MTEIRRDYRSAEAAEYRRLYKTARWRRLRAAQLARRPLCEPCERARPQRITPATVVHHKRRHGGDERLFFASENLESACAPCHDGPLQRAEVQGFSTEVGPDGWPVDPQHRALR